MDGSREVMEATMAEVAEVAVRVAEVVEVAVRVETVGAVVPAITHLLMLVLAVKRLSHV